MTVRESIQTLRRQLEPEYGRGETQAMIRLIFDYLKGWDTVHIFMNEEKELSPETWQSIRQILKRLEKGEPIQYITGSVQFFGCKFMVDRRVLIPRPETEMMVDIIVDRYSSRSDLDVLDVCCGSGCIAISLARNLPFSKVTALDVSADALDVARENARINKAKNITFIHEDIFRYEPLSQSLDIVVSNPPYIDLSEQSSMSRNVLDYEPHIALFVPDENPLLFYSRIVTVAASALRSGGSLYFEINPRHADDIKRLLEMEGFTDITLEKDIHGTLRFAIAKLPSDD